MNNKKKSITAGVAAVFCAATLALFGISGDKAMYVDYELTQDNNKAELALTVPDDFEADIAELLCNDMSVTKALLPNDKLTTIPFIFTDLSNLEIRFYCVGEVIGIGKFEDGKIKVAVKDDIEELPAADETEPEPESEKTFELSVDKNNEEVRVNVNEVTNEE